MDIYKWMAWTIDVLTPDGTIQVNSPDVISSISQWESPILTILSDENPLPKTVML